VAPAGEEDPLGSTAVELDLALWAPCGADVEAIGVSVRWGGGRTLPRAVLCIPNVTRRMRLAMRLAVITILPRHQVSQPGPQYARTVSQWDDAQVLESPGEVPTLRLSA
jgi:hypothetical protein